jgi:hypothetical protein
MNTVINNGSVAFSNFMLSDINKTSSSRSVEFLPTEPDLAEDDSWKTQLEINKHLNMGFTMRSTWGSPQGQES